MLQRTLIADLAKELGKSEEEVRQFIEALWQRLPLVTEVEPPFVRYLDARIEGVKSTLEATINGLKATMEQGFLRAEERDEALRREMMERHEALRREMIERYEALRREMIERTEMVKQELMQEINIVRQELNSLRNEVKRLERWFLSFSSPMILMLAGVIVQNLLK